MTKCVCYGFYTFFNKTSESKNIIRWGLRDKILSNGGPFCLICVSLSLFDVKKFTNHCVIICESWLNYPPKTHFSDNRCFMHLEFRLLLRALICATLNCCWPLLDPLGNFVCVAVVIQRVPPKICLEALVPFLSV